MTNVFEGSGGDVAPTLEDLAAECREEVTEEESRAAFDRSAAKHGLTETVAEMRELAASVPPVATAQEERELAVITDAFRRWTAKTGPIEITFPDRITAWIVMSALQLAWRHPAAPLRSVIERVGRQLQDAVSDTAEAYELAEAGWGWRRPAGNPERDR